MTLLPNLVLCVCVSRSVVSDSLRPHRLYHQASLSVKFSRQEYWSGLPFPSPEYLPDQGSNLGLLHCRQILYSSRSPKLVTKESFAALCRSAMEQCCGGRNTLWWIFVRQVESSCITFVYLPQVQTQNLQFSLQWFLELATLALHIAYIWGPLLPDIT